MIFFSAKAGNGWGCTNILKPNKPPFKDRRWTTLAEITVVRTADVRRRRPNDDLGRIPGRIRGLEVDRERRPLDPGREIRVPIRGPDTIPDLPDQDPGPNRDLGNLFDETGIFCLTKMFMEIKKAICVEFYISLILISYNMTSVRPIEQTQESYANFFDLLNWLTKMLKCG